MHRIAEICWLLARWPALKWMILVRWATAANGRCSVRRNAGGVLPRGGLLDKWNYVTWRPKDGVKRENRWGVDRWTTHHLWGRTTDGTAFSTARQRHPWVSFGLDEDVPAVHAAGFLGEKGTVEEEGAIVDVVGP